MLAVLELYPYFSKQSQHLLFETFFNDNIYLAVYNDTYYLDNKVTDHTTYYFGKFTNPASAYKVYRNIIIVMSLLGVFKLNKKYLTIDINDLKLLDQYIVYEKDELYKPFVDKSSYTTICITFDDNKYYVQEFCNFNNTLLKTLYSDSKIINIKNHFTRRWREKNSFENTFWKLYNNKKDIIDSAILQEAIQNNVLDLDRTGFVTLEKIIEARNEKDEYTNT